MALAHVGTTTVAQTSASLTLAAALPGGAAAGHLAVFFVGGEETTPSPTWPTGFTDTSPSPAASRTNQSLIAAYKILTSGDITAGTLTTTMSTSKARTGHLAVFSGVLSPAVQDGAIGANATSVATINAATVTTAADGDLLFAAVSYQSSTDRSPVTPGGYTIAGTSALSTPTGSQTAVYFATAGTAGATGTTALSWTGNVNSVSLRLAFQAVAVGSTGTASLTLSGSGTAKAAGSGTASLSLSAAAADNTIVGQIGDSLTSQSPGPGTTDMESRYVTDGFVTAHVDGITGRFVYNAGDTSGGTPAVLDGWASTSFNPYDIVIALGTNDTLSAVSTTWAGALTNLRAKIASTCPGPHHIWWVNLVADPTGGQGMDGIIGSHGNSIADYNSFLTSNLNGTTERILDWNTYAKANLTSGTYWQNDSNHVHMTLAGYTARNAWIADQMDFVKAATATASLTLSGSGVAKGAASGTASLTLGASGNAVAPATGTASLTLGASGTAKASPAATGSLTLGATGTAKAAAVGTASVSLSGTATTTSAATATASLTLAGSAAAAAPASGTGSLTLAASGNAAGAGTGTGSLTLGASGSATGPGQAAGSASLALSATGTAATTGSGSGSVSLSATGATRAPVAATAAITLSGAGSPGAPATGSAALTLFAAATAKAATQALATLTLAATGAAKGAGSGTATLELAAVGTAPAGGIVVVTPPSRIYPIPIDVRVMAVGRETRVYPIPALARVLEAT